MISSTKVSVFEWGFKKLSKLVDLFLKETSFKNESEKICKVCRYSLLMSIALSILELILGIYYRSSFGIQWNVVFLAAFIIMFIFSYRVSSRKILVALNIAWIPWIFSQVALYGWECGIQQLLILMLITEIFCTYWEVWIKALVVFVLFMIRAVLYVFSIDFAPSFDTSFRISFVLQVLISFFVYLGIGYICYIYIHETQSEEGKLVQYNIKLENEANTDALTGLFNRRRILETLESIYSTNDPSGFSVAMCDIDFFKKVNDNYGHDVGDEVLKGVAGVLQSYTRDGMYACRWGGEEFLLVFDRMNGDQAFPNLHSILNEIRNLKFNIGDRSFSITMTMGLAEYDFKSDADTIIKQADEKMYSGKENGRNQIVF